MLHFLVPAVIAFAAFPRHKAPRVFLVLIATMIVDLDHLLADPIYDPGRCSIGFHPLHSHVAIGVYGLMMLVPKLRLVATGLLIHMLVDLSDCYI